MTSKKLNKGAMGSRGPARELLERIPGPTLLRSHITDTRQEYVVRMCLDVYVDLSVQAYSAAFACKWGMYFASR